MFGRKRVNDCNVFNQIDNDIVQFLPMYNVSQI